MTTIASPTPAFLSRHLSAEGAREFVLLDGVAGTRLLVDRSSPGGGDARLLAHLAADESDLNAWHICREYLADPWRSCRALTRADLARVVEEPRPATAPIALRVLEDGHGSRFRLAVLGRPAQLRWLREGREEGEGDVESAVSAREVVGAVESYEPVRTMSRAAIERFRTNRRVSVATLGLELRRLERSPIVLNRRLREAVLAATTREQVSLSAIAIACGRMKRDRRGNGSGETSWIARRVGLVAEPGARSPNPWVHTDTLALIARDGLGVAPHEVELV